MNSKPEKQMADPVRLGWYPVLFHSKTDFFPGGRKLRTIVFLFCVCAMTVVTSCERTPAASEDSEETLDSRIVGGQQVTKQNTFFCMTLEEKNGQHYRGPCGATLITRQWAVTAAHCLSNYSKNDLKPRMDALYCGAMTPWDNDAQGNKNGGYRYQIVDIVEHIEHPDHVPGAANPHDIALLRLKEPVDKFFEPLPIAGKVFDDQVEAGDTCKVYGFGQTLYGGAKSNELLEVSLDYVDQAQCRKQMSPRDITDDMMCAYAVNKDACGGDSGGPLVVDGTLMGVVSWGYKCAEKGYPGVYSRVGQAIDWIQKHVDDPELKIALESPDSDSDPEPVEEGYSVSDDPSFETTADQVLESYDTLYVKIWKSTINASQMVLQEAKVQGIGRDGESLTITTELEYDGDGAFEGSVELDSFLAGTWIQVFAEIEDKDGNRKSLGGPYGGYRVWIISEGYAVSKNSDFSTDGDQYFSTAETLYVKVWDSEANAGKITVQKADFVGTGQDGKSLTISHDLVFDSADDSYKTSIKLKDFAPNSWLLVYAEVKDSKGKGFYLKGYRIFLM